MTGAACTAPPGTIKKYAANTTTNAAISADPLRPPLPCGDCRNTGNAGQNAELLRSPRAPAVGNVTTVAWERGEVILRREIVLGHPWLVVPVVVVDDDDALLVTYIPEGAPFGFPAGEWPTPDGRHPWHTRLAWEGHGTLMLQRPGDSYAIWHFWTGPERTFAGWYINLQEPFRRTSVGYDTQDLELDILVTPQGSWTYKDWDLVEQRVHEGRFTAGQAEEIRTDAKRIAGDLSNGERWWDPSWSSWLPDRSWPKPSLPAGWDATDR